MSDGARDLLVRGIAAAKAGERDEARRYLEWALRQDPSSYQQMEAWLWLSSIADEKGEARRWLEQVLANDPGDPRALRRLALLDGRLQPAELIDPDHPPATSSLDGELVVEVERFACPSCGGQMAYAPDGNGLQCDHCGQRTGVLSGARAAEPAAEDFILALATTRGHSTPQASPTFACPACGARFLVAPATLSLTCPYCDATYAVDESDERLLISPQAIVPLMVTLDEAERSLTAWLRQNVGNKPFAVDRLTAIYLPLWLFEMGGVVEWRVEDSNWTREGDPLNGAEPPASPIAVLACLNPRPGLAAVVESTDPALLVAFDAAYLAAHPAETYTLSMADAALRARQRALRMTGEKLEAGLGGVRLNLRSARMVVTSYVLAFAPAWLADVRCEETKHPLIVSGVTARVYAGGSSAGRCAG